MSEPQKKKIVELPIAQLRPHPLNAELYQSRAAWQIEDLAQDIKANGLQEEVEVVPPSKGKIHDIISGSGRTAAGKSLGWKTIRCWIRDDLVKAGPEAIESRVIEANLHRRQLSRLDTVRSYRFLLERARKPNGSRLHKDEVKGDLRDRVAQRFGTSGKTMERWVKVLDLPIALQQLVDDGPLPMTVAIKLVNLPVETLDDIAARIGKGESWKAVTAEHIDAHVDEVQSRKPAKQVVLKFICHLSRFIRDLTGPISEDDEAVFNGYPNALRRGRTLIAALVAQLKQAETTADELHDLISAAQGTPYVDSPPEEETDGEAT